MKNIDLSISLIEFADKNFSLFSIRGKSPDFPDVIIERLKSGEVYAIAEEYGFAIIKKEIRIGSLARLCRPELMFIHVYDGFQGHGKGRGLVQRALLEQNYCLTLLCEGNKRKDYFMKCGFTVEEEYEAEVYNMAYKE